MEKEDLKIPIKKMILDLGSMREKVKELLRNVHEFHRLLEAILEQDFYYDEDLPLPTAKELSEKTGINSKKLKEQVKKIYSDLIFRKEEDSWRNPVFNFKKTIYNFILQGRQKKTISFSVNHLEVIPRVGEEIEIPFFKAYLGTNYFYVKNISHEFNDTIHELNLFLCHGSYNFFWHYRRDKAVELKEIDLFELYELEDWELKQKIKLNR